jgi:hypothetical protein
MGGGMNVAWQGEYLVLFWLAMIGADRNWPTGYSSRIDGCVEPVYEDGWKVR